MEKIFLSSREIAELTGFAHAKKQAQVLQKLGVRCVIIELNRQKICRVLRADLKIENRD